MKEKAGQFFFLDLWWVQMKGPILFSLARNVGWTWLEPIGSANGYKSSCHLDVRSNLSLFIDPGRSNGDGVWGRSLYLDIGRQLRHIPLGRRAF